jgi:hypothetical protein
MKKITTLVLVLFVCFVSQAEVSTSERAALVKLNESTQGSQWKNKWDLSKPVASWYGVTVKNDKVIAIDLSDNNLSGSLPEELSKLTSLESINLFKNTISGSLPQSIGNLTSLKTLNISFNKLTGKIPASIGNAKQLQTIELYFR